MIKLKKLEKKHMEEVALFYMKTRITMIGGELAYIIINNRKNICLKIYDMIRIFSMECKIRCLTKNMDKFLYKLNEEDKK